MLPPHLPNVLENLNNWQLLHYYSTPKAPIVRLIALYKKPPDLKAFHDHYFNIHAPLVRQLPRLRKFKVARITGAAIGEPKYHLLAEVHFNSQQALDPALASPQGKASAKDSMSFASGLLDLFFAEIKD